jgi:hypothetical protein
MDHIVGLYAQFLLKKFLLMHSKERGRQAQGRGEDGRSPRLTASGALRGWRRPGLCEDDGYQGSILWAATGTPLWGRCAVGSVRSSSALRRWGSPLLRGGGDLLSFVAVGISSPLRRQRSEDGCAVGEFDWSESRWGRRRGPGAVNPKCAYA